MHFDIFSNLVGYFQKLSITYNLGQNCWDKFEKKNFFEKPSLPPVQCCSRSFRLMATKLRQIQHSFIDPFMLMTKHKIKEWPYSKFTLKFPYKCRFKKKKRMSHNENVLPEIQSKVLKKKKDLFYNHVPNCKKAKFMPEILQKKLSSSPRLHPYIYQKGPFSSNTKWIICKDAIHLIWLHLLL